MGHATQQPSDFPYTWPPTLPCCGTLDAAVPQVPNHRTCTIRWFVFIASNIILPVYIGQPVGVVEGSGVILVGQSCHHAIVFVYLVIAGGRRCQSYLGKQQQRLHF